jgi:hypothetical protein
MKMSYVLPAVVMFAAQAFAGADHEFKNTVAPQAEETLVPLDEFSLNSSYVFDGDFRDSSLGDQNAMHNRFRFDHRLPLGSGWYFKVGAAYDRFDFSSSRAPVPNHLQSAAAILSVEYKVNGRTGFLFETSPGVYFSNDINSSAFDIPTNVGLAYPVFGGDKFYLVGGVSFSLLRSYPFLPVLGVEWKPNDRWELRGYLPEPRLIYTQSDACKLWIGGELAGGAYRTDERDTAPRKLSGEVLTYSEYRVGAGVIYAGWKPFQVDVGAGYAFERAFDYHRADERFATNGAPYVAVQIRAEF